MLLTCKINIRKSILCLVILLIIFIFYRYFKNDNVYINNSSYEDDTIIIDGNLVPTDKCMLICITII